MIKIATIVILMTVMFVVTQPLSAHGASYTLTEKVEFGSALEETLGHFKALEDNLDAGDGVNAAVHATHPIAELYDLMKPVLMSANTGLDERFNTILVELKDKASTQVSKSQAQSAIDDAKDIVEEARMTIIGADLSSDPMFKLMLMLTLLETSAAEYKEAVSDGTIVNMPEFQDGSAFVWRAEQILDTIEDDLDTRDYMELKEMFAQINTAYDQRVDPSVVDQRTARLLASVEVHSTSYKSEKVEFGSALEETLGHFKALEDNLDAGDGVNAAVHATHPIAELYDLMKPVLMSANTGLDERFNTILVELKDKASTQVSKSQAQSAIDDAKDIVEEARMTIIGADLSSDPMFKLMLMLTLLETSAAEYKEAVSDGTIVNMPEFQDGSAFVWRAEQILDTIEDDLDTRDYMELKEMFVQINTAYDQRVDPSVVDQRTTHLIISIETILGVSGGDGDDEEDGLLRYVENINELLESARNEYNAGNNDLALSYVTNAYLNNYEFLEGPLVDAGERELMEKVEIMMREDLRNMIKQGAPASQVSDLIDQILIEMEAVAVVVPEFGIMVIVVLAAAVMIVLVATRNRNMLSLSSYN